MAERRAPSPLRTERFGDAVAELIVGLPRPQDLDGASTCGEAVAHVLLQHTHGLLAQLVDASRLGEVERVHQARVAARRLRTDLRTFRPVLVHAEVAEALEGLRSLASTIGIVRDHDVFSAVLGRHAERHPDESGLAKLVERERSNRDDLLDTMRAAVTGERTVRILASVASISLDPPVGVYYDEPAALVLTTFALKPWRRLVKTAREVDDASPVEALHELRLRVKKARYAIDAVALVRREARDQARALARLQTTLGELADAALTIRLLRAELAMLDGDAAFAAGLVVAFEQQRIDECRVGWQPRWDAARRRRVRAWMSDDDD